MYSSKCTATNAWTDSAPGLSCRCCSTRNHNVKWKCFCCCCCGKKGTSDTSCIYGHHAATQPLKCCLVLAFQHLDSGRPSSGCQGLKILLPLKDGRRWASMLIITSNSFTKTFCFTYNVIYLYTEARVIYSGTHVRVLVCCSLFLCIRVRTDTYRFDGCQVHAPVRDEQVLHTVECSVPLAANLLSHWQRWPQEIKAPQTLEQSDADALYLLQNHRANCNIWSVHSRFTFNLVWFISLFTVEIDSFTDVWEKPKP